MFWKNTESNVEITLNLEDKREHFRLRPEPPIEIHFNNNASEVIDISAGGVAFHSDTLEAGEVIFVKIMLYDFPFHCQVEIIGKSDDGVCRCRYLDLGEDEVDRLHKFVIRGQKEMIRRQR